MSLETVVETDVLVIGGGIAGCFAAIKAKEQGADVALVDRGYVSKTGASPWPAFLGVFNPEWGHDLAAWMKQVSIRCEYVNNPEWTEIVLKDSHARFLDRISWGEKFYKEASDEWVFYPPRPHLAKYPIQAIVHPRRQHAEAERAQVIKTGVRIMDRVRIYDLLKQDGNIVGAIGMPIESYDLYIFKAKATVLATGGPTLKGYGGAPYAAMTGDGEAMAYRAGAVITGKEWTDLHADSAEFPGRRSVHMGCDFEKFHGDYSAHRFINAEGDVYTETDTSPFDNVIVALEVDAGRAPIFEDLTSRARGYLPGLVPPEGVPTRSQIDLEAERLHRRRVVLGRSTGMSPEGGGEGIVPINTKCATQLPGLYVAGACCGIRNSGSRYPSVGYASMSCSVTGTRAGLGAAEYASRMKKTMAVDRKEFARLKGIMYEPTERKGGFSPGWTTQVLRNIVTPYWVLIIKHGERLQSALTQVEFIRDRVLPKMTAKDPHELRLAHEIKSVVLNAEMRLRASLFRTESRGSHYREDYPRRDDPNWLAWINIKQEQGEMKLYKEPIPKKWWPDLSLAYEERYVVRFRGE